jgi:hypothetical protein
MNSGIRSEKGWGKSGRKDVPETDKYAFALSIGALRDAGRLMGLFQNADNAENPDENGWNDDKSPCTDFDPGQESANENNSWG